MSEHQFRSFFGQFMNYVLWKRMNNNKKNVGLEYSNIQKELDYFAPRYYSRMNSCARGPIDKRRHKKKIQRWKGIKWKKKKNSVLWNDLSYNHHRLLLIIFLRCCSILCSYVKKKKILPIILNLIWSPIFFFRIFFFWIKNAHALFLYDKKKLRLVLY